MTRHEIVTPFPGVFYRHPGPDSPPFVNEGDAVEAGQTVALGRIESPTPPSASPRIVCTGTIVAELPSGVAASGYMPGYG